MSILDKVQIGNSVQINLELSKDRLSNDVIEAVNTSSVATISDFRIKFTFYNSYHKSNICPNFVFFVDKYF